MSTTLTSTAQGTASPKKSKKEKVNLFQVKTYSHPWENRASLSDKYQPPVTDREAWWRCQIRVTPVPGSYDSNTFINDLSRRPNTYSFKSDGRKLPSDFAGKGAVLLPGEYEYHSFLEDLSKKPASYRFKAERRDAFDVLNSGLKDKNINVSPNAYDMEKYLAVDGERTQVRNYMFKSQSKRFPTQFFRPKEGPSPGSYAVQETAIRRPSVTSSFRSKTPRFQTSHTTSNPMGGARFYYKKVPGPGSYEKAFQHPLPPTISKMGRQYGLFFTSDFQT